MERQRESVQLLVSNGFDPVSHELRHLKKPLDLALHLRLSGLPNNATLDLVESIVGSTVQDVTIARQLSTARHEVKCKTSDSLLEVVRLVSESMGVDLISANEEGHPSCSYMNRQYRGELELSFRTLGSIGIGGGRMLIRYLRLHLDNDKLEEIERGINEEKTEKERLERRFETAKKENEARLRREEEEEKQIERLREEEERRVREKRRSGLHIPDRLPSGPPLPPSDDGWAYSGGEKQGTVHLLKSQQHSRVVPWMRKTEYISHEFNRFGVSADRQETKVGYGTKNKGETELYRDRASQIDAIEKTFQDVKKKSKNHLL